MCHAKSFLIESIWLCLHVALTLPHKQMDDRTFFRHLQSMTADEFDFLSDADWLFLSVVLAVSHRRFHTVWFITEKITHYLLAGWENHVTEPWEHAASYRDWKSGLKSPSNDIYWMEATGWKISAQMEIRSKGCFILCNHMTWLNESTALGSSDSSPSVPFCVFFLWPLVSLVTQKTALRPFTIHCKCHKWNLILMFFSFLKDCPTMPSALILSSIS